MWPIRESMRVEAQLVTQPNHIEWGRTEATIYWSWRNGKSTINSHVRDCEWQLDIYVVKSKKEILI